MFGRVMDRFVEQSAASVMFRGTLENVVTAELLDEIFVATAKRQRPGELLFSSVVDLLAMVATGSRKSVNDAYRARKEQFTVSITTGFLFGIATRHAAFVIRQHRQTLRYELLGRRRKIGRCSRGMLYEQKVRLSDADGKPMKVRRITIKLKKPTRDGDMEIHLLTNLPARAANAQSVANLYLHRWTVEKAFQELDQALNGEIKTLGYPAAALLSFCVALLSYNVISVVKSGLAAAHGAAMERETISGYYLAGELAAAYHGMMIAVPPAQWTRHFASLTPAELARILKTLAAKVRSARFRKNTRGPKKPPPQRTYDKRHPHVSTARILAQRQQSKTDAVLA